MEGNVYYAEVDDADEGPDNVGHNSKGSQECVEVQETELEPQCDLHDALHFSNLKRRSSSSPSSDPMPTSEDDLILTALVCLDCTIFSKLYCKYDKTAHCNFFKKNHEQLRKGFQSFFWPYS